VPYNPYNLKIPRYGEMIVALAGPLSNLLIALIFSIYIRMLGAAAMVMPGGKIAILIVLVNLTLAAFNMIPIPPLDGFKVFWGLLPYRFSRLRSFIERNMFLFLIIFLLTFSVILDPIVAFLFKLFTGIAI
jgi:Zn-dependent protease